MRLCTLFHLRVGSQSQGPPRMSLCSAYAKMPRDQLPSACQIMCSTLPQAVHPAGDQPRVLPFCV